MKARPSMAKACALSLMLLALPGCSLTSEEWLLMATAVAVGVSARASSGYDDDDPGLGYGQFSQNIACVTSLERGQRYRPAASAAGIIGASRSHSDAV